MSNDDWDADNEEELDDEVRLRPLWVEVVPNTEDDAAVAADVEKTEENWFVISEA